MALSNRNVQRLHLKLTTKAHLKKEIVNVYLIDNGFFAKLWQEI